MPKPNTRMTAMRQRALEAFAEGRTDTLAEFSTTALWEVARVQQRKANRHALARVLVELFDRTDPDDSINVPIELRIHLPGLSVFETKPDTGRPVSDTTPLALEPSAPPPKAKDYPDWLKARAVAMHKAGKDREAIRAMLVEQFGKAPDPSNWTKTLRRWEAIGTSAIVGL